MSDIGRYFVLYTHPTDRARLMEGTSGYQDVVVIIHFSLAQNRTFVNEAVQDGTFARAAGLWP